MTDICEKSLNSRCICGNGLNWVNLELVMFEPCEHILHKECFKDLIDHTICIICNASIKNTLYENNVNKSKHYQKYIDLVSIKNCNYMSTTDNSKFIAKLPYITHFVLKLPFCKGFDQAEELVSHLLELANVKLIVNGMENLPSITSPKIIIANHTSDLDMFVIFKLFKCGFVSSSKLLDSWFGRKICDIVPLVLIKRHEHNKKVVNAIREYVKKEKSICVFPEGMYSHPDTLIQFRTGAFNTGFQVCPVVIKFEPAVSDSSLIEFIKKLFSYDEIKVTVNILPTEQPPFSNNKIQEIRNSMAKVGNMALSRVSNRDIADHKDD